VVVAAAAVVVVAVAVVVAGAAAGGVDLSLMMAQNISVSKSPIFPFATWVQ
jgi:hypothetical protein